MDARSSNKSLFSFVKYTLKFIVRPINQDANYVWAGSSGYIEIRMRDRLFSPPINRREEGVETFSSLLKRVSGARPQSPQTRDFSVQQAKNDRSAPAIVAGTQYSTVIKKNHADFPLGFIEPLFTTDSVESRSHS